MPRFHIEWLRLEPMPEPEPIILEEIIPESVVTPIAILEPPMEKKIVKKVATKISRVQIPPVKEIIPVDDYFPIRRRKKITNHLINPLRDVGP